MRLFGSDRIVKIFDKFGIEEGEELQHSWLNKSIETAQKRVEQHHFSMRKRTLEYDDVMNKQREIVYGIRKEALLSEDPHDLLFSLIENGIADIVDESALPREVNGEEDKTFNWEHLLAWLNLKFPVGFTREEFRGVTDGSHDELILKIIEKIEKAYLDKNARSERPAGGVQKRSF